MFQDVYDAGTWRHNYDKYDSSLPGSGSGSTLNSTAKVRRSIEEAVVKYGIKRFIDAPCGDLTWMRTLFPFFDEHGVEYTGVDIVPGEIERLREEFPTRKFLTMDMVLDVLPRADVIFSREALQHMNAEDNMRVLNNWKASGSTVSNFGKQES